MGRVRWPNRQVVLIGLLFSLFVLFSLLQGQPTPEPPYSLDSAAPGGLRALRLWLAEMDYRIHRGRPDRATLNDTNAPIDVLFVYPNTTPYTEDEAAVLYEWVTAGGTLVLVGPSDADTALHETFGVYPVQELGGIATEAQAQPLLPAAPARTRRVGLTDYVRIADAPRAVPVLLFENNASPDSAALPRTTRPTVAVQALGDGLVWHLSARHDLTNGALANDPGRDSGDNSAENLEALLVPALLRNVPDGGGILFDTYHLYGAAASRSDAEIASLSDWLVRTSFGWALLFIAAALLLYLVLQGVRLGPPLPVQSTRRRRAAAEFVAAMAALQQRTGQRQRVAQHHKQRLKRALGQPYHIPPDLPDERFLERLRRADGRYSDAALRTAQRLLHDLSRNPSESALVDAVARMDEFLRRGEWES